MTQAAGAIRRGLRALRIKTAHPPGSRRIPRQSHGLQVPQPQQNRGVVRAAAHQEIDGEGRSTQRGIPRGRGEGGEIEIPYRTIEKGIPVCPAQDARLLGRPQGKG